MGFYLGLTGYFDRVSLIASRLNILETHLIDFKECFGEETRTAINGGGYEKLEGAELVIIAAAKIGGQVSSRDEYLKANLGLIKDIAREIRDRAPKATVISCTSPVDAFVMVLLRESGFDRHQLLGFCRNDSQRFRYMVAKVMGLSQPFLDGIVLGEHGETQVPLFSSLAYEGKQLSVSPGQKEQILALLKGWYRHWQAQNSRRTTTWTSATSILRTILALGLAPKDPGHLIRLATSCPENESTLTHDSHFRSKFASIRAEELALGSVFLEGEYGISDVALGMPITKGNLGWGKVIELELWPGELAGLRKSAEKVKALYDCAIG
jgi:malate/lactate dehydrogenase